MAKVGMLLPRLFLAFVVLAVVLNMRSATTFLPPAGTARTHQRLASSVGTVGALASIFGAAPSAQADIDEAAGKLADTVYPMFDKINWQSNPQFVKWLGTAPEKWDGKKLNAALDKLLEAGLAMDQSLVAKAVQAHLKGIVDSRADPKDILKTSGGDVKEITVSIANMLASAGAKKVYAVYDGFKQAGINDLNREEMKVIGKADAAQGYRDFLALADEIRKASADS